MSGRFVWFELMTTDTKGAIAFYSEVLGFRTEAFGDAQGPEPYTMWVGSQGPMGGVTLLPEAAKAMGAPPHWMGHVDVDDVDRAAGLVEELGGKVLVAPMDVPKVGRFSVVTDLHGASISLFKGEGAPMPEHDTTRQGEVGWHELYTGDDGDRVLAFYNRLFGWEAVHEMPLPGGGKYLMFGTHGKRLGGIMAPAPQHVPPSWLYYFSVDDLDAALARATAAGAKVLFGPMPVPTGGRVVAMTDPQGAGFALHMAAKP